MDMDFSGFVSQNVFMKCIALLRGINVGGNNKVPMAELKKCFANLGFENIISYINSGNIIFETSEASKTELVKQCEMAIEKQFGFRVICSVIFAKELDKALAQAPAWWGKDSGSKHNAIFVIAPQTASAIMKEVGDAKPDYERVAVVEPIIFWSAPIVTFSRTRYSKIVGSSSYQSVTIRNSSTTKKLLGLCK